MNLEHLFYVRSTSLINRNFILNQFGSQKSVIQLRFIYDLSTTRTRIVSVFTSLTLS